MLFTLKKVNINEFFRIFYITWIFRKSTSNLRNCSVSFDITITITIARLTYVCVMIICLIIQQLEKKLHISIHTKNITHQINRKTSIEVNSSLKWLHNLNAAPVRMIATFTETISSTTRLIREHARLGYTIEMNNFTKLLTCLLI